MRIVSYNPEYREALLEMSLRAWGPVFRGCTMTSPSSSMMRSALKAGLQLGRVQV